ncbi:MAG: four helix bundle protein [Phycisphaeraceae bacterium]
MTPDVMKERTLDLGSRILRVADSLPDTHAGQTIGRQSVKSGTSIGANYREALHASSPRHFVTIMEIAQREANETSYWIELIMRSGMLKEQQLEPLHEECRQIYAIITTTILTKKKNMDAAKDSPNHQ